MSEGTKSVGFSSLFRRTNARLVFITTGKQKERRISITSIDSTHVRVRGHSTGLCGQSLPTSPAYPHPNQRPTHNRSSSQPTFEVPLYPKAPSLPDIQPSLKTAMALRKLTRPGGSGAPDQGGSVGAAQSKVEPGRRSNSSDGNGARRARVPFGFGRKAEVSIEEEKAAKPKATGKTFVMVCTATDPSTYPKTASKMVFRIGEGAKADGGLHGHNIARKSDVPKEKKRFKHTMGNSKKNRKAQLQREQEDLAARDRSSSLPAARISRPIVVRSTSDNNTLPTPPGLVLSPPTSPLHSPMPSLYSTPLSSPLPSPRLSPAPSPKPFLRSSSPRPPPSPLSLSTTGLSENLSARPHTPLPPPSPAVSTKSSKSLSRSPSLPTLMHGSRRAARRPSLVPVSTVV